MQKKLILAAHKKSIENADNLCLVMADIDHFKNINDSYGHDKGDTILLNISAAIRAFLTENDIAVRWGGEEFLLLLGHTNQQQAFAKVEALRQQIAAIKPHQDFPELTVTMSFGLIEWQPLASLECMLQQADAALYKSKHSGRNKTTIATGQSSVFNNIDAVS